MHSNKSKCITTWNSLHRSLYIPKRHPPGQTVDPGLDENEPELGIPILAVPFEMLSDAHRLLDEVVNVLRDVGGEALALEDSKDLVPGDESHLGDTVAIPENHANLGRGQPLLGQLEDLLLDVVRGELQPVGNGAAIGERRLRDALTGRVHTTHGESNVQSKILVRIL